MAVVCATDFSPSATLAARAAIAIAGLRPPGELILVHAASPSTTDAARQALRAQLEASAALLARPGVELRTELLIGEPVEAVTSLVATEGAELVVLSARGVGAGSLLRLGSFAEAMVARAEVPVLVVRDADPFERWAAGGPLRAMIGLDDSATCDVGLDWLKRMRTWGSVDVSLVAVYYADEAARHYGLPHAGAVDANPDVERLLARDLLRRFGRAQGRGEVRAMPTLGHGRIGDHLLEAATAAGADLVVVGTSQKTGLGRLGSVSAVVVHDGKQSVLCIPAGAHVRAADAPAMRIALVATDLSSFANRAVPYAYALAHEGSPEVHLLTVLDDDDDLAARAPGVREALLALALPTAKTVAHVEAGDPADKIAEVAARVGADVICIASRARSGIARALIGSTADKLLRETRIPVLVLRPKGE